MKNNDNGSCGGAPTGNQNAKGNKGWMKGGVTAKYAGVVEEPIRNRLKVAVLVDKETGCWNWIKSKFKGGYGAIRINGKSTSAHRVSYQEFVGQIPESMHVLHKCDNPSCINPEHLWLGTHRENMMDKMAKGRDNVKGRSFKRITRTDQSGQGNHSASPTL